MPSRTQVPADYSPLVYARRKAEFDQLVNGAAVYAQMRSDVGNP
ncbi:hypothetical protein [Serratia fonticola]